MSSLQRRALYSVILLLGLLWIFLSADRAGSATAGRIPAPQRGFLAPELALSTLQGEIVRLKEQRGQAILINFWATWCPPCRAEMPLLEKMYQEYQRQGLIVLAVNVTSQDSRPAVAQFASEYGLTFPILFDETGEASRKYEIRSLPSTFFIQRSGLIAEIVIGGPMSEALLRTRIEEILKTPAP